MKFTPFDVITGKGRSNEGVGNKNYRALVDKNKVRRFVDSSSRQKTVADLKSTML